MFLGSSTKSFGGLSVSETAKLFANAGLSCAELCFCQTDLSGWKYNFSGYKSLPAPESVKNAVGIFNEMGVSVCAIGIYNCLWQGDAVKNSDSLLYFSEICSLASDAGVPLVTTHTGTPGMFFGGTKAPQNLREICTEYFLFALFEAYKRGIKVAVEFGENDALNNYKDYLYLKKRTLEAFGTCEMLKYTGVPVCDYHDADYSDAAIFHLKDKKTGSKFYECIGCGNGDFSDFFDIAEKYRDVPMILEYVNGTNLEFAVRRLGFRI